MRFPFGRAHWPRGAPAAVLLSLVVLAAGCAAPSTRPARGAVPGEGRPAPTSEVPPTLSASDLRFRRLPTPSPGLQASPAASPFASPSPSALPPIVRSVQPPANGMVPLGAPVAVGAILVSRGADLATATLSMNGAELPGTIDRANPRQWSIGAAQALAAGTYTARVFVTDAAGARGGFTWQFRVGDPAPSPSAVGANTPEAGGSPVPPPPATPAPAAPRASAPALAVTPTPPPKPTAPARP